MQNPKEDDIVVTQKSKRKRTAKSFGDDYIVYLVDDTPRTIEEVVRSEKGLQFIPLLMQYGVRWIQLCLMELGKLLNVLMGVNQ